MKSIPLNVQKLLIAHGVLVKNVDSTVVFQGLNPTESQFFLDYNLMPLTSLKENEEAHFHELRHRHMIAMVKTSDTRHLGSKEASANSPRRLSDNSKG